MDLGPLQTITWIATAPLATTIPQTEASRYIQRALYFNTLVCCIYVCLYFGFVESTICIFQSEKSLGAVVFGAVWQQRRVTFGWIKIWIWQTNGLGFEIVGTWQCIIQDFLIYDSRLNSFFFLGPSHRFGGHHYMHLLTSSPPQLLLIRISAIYSCHDAMFNAICQNHGITFSNAAASCKAFHQGIYGMATSTAIRR